MGSRHDYKNKNPKKNVNFFQFNKIVPQILIKLSAERPSVIPVYMALVTLSNKLGCSIVPQSKIAEQIGKSTRTVARSINYLATKQYIAIARSGRANVYILNYNLIWNNFNYKKSTVGKYISFPANVTLSSKQNPEFFKKFSNFVKAHGHKFIDLSKVKQKKVKPNTDPNRAKKRREYIKVKRAKAKLAVQRGWTTSLRQCKQLRKEGYHVGYQTSMFNKRGQNKKPVKNK